MVAYSGSRVRGSHSVATWRVPRTRGAFSGLLLVLLGAWGALVPFVGPHFGYAYTPDATWTMTAGRLWLNVVPGVVALLSGLILMISANRAIGLWVGWLAAMAGAWFAVGPTLSRLWNGGQPQTGKPVATDTVHSVVTEIGFYTGLGVVIVFLAAAALGRFSVIGLRESQIVEPAVVDEPVAETTARPSLAEQETTTMPVQREATTTGATEREAEREAEVQQGERGTGMRGMRARRAETRAAEREESRDNEV